MRTLLLCFLASLGAAGSLQPADSSGGTWKFVGPWKLEQGTVKGTRENGSVISGRYSEPIKEDRSHFLKVVPRHRFLPR
jgi:hypothetical protein